MRFVLFVVAILALALIAGNLAISVLNPDQTTPISSNLDPGDPLSQRELFEQDLISSQGVVEDSLRALAFPVGLTIVIFILTTVIYRLHPATLRRQKHLEPLREEKDPHFYREIQSLARSAGVSPTPEIMLGKGLKSQNSQAFGLPRRYFLRLEGGLRLLFRKAPNSFRAIVLHELAHIFNRDIGRTYFAQALWIAAVWLVYIPFSISLVFVFISSVAPNIFAQTVDLNRLFTIVLPTYLCFVFQLSAIIVIIAVIRASLLRTRELYADGRAASWGAESSLSSLLQPASVSDKGASGFRWLRLHPTAEERLAALRNPAALFQISTDVAFTVGLLFAVVGAEVFWESTIVFAGISASGGYLTSLLQIAAQTNEQLPFLTEALQWLSLIVLTGSFAFVIVLVFVIVMSLAYVVSGTVGLQTQQEAIVELLEDRPRYTGYLRMWLTAALMALGIELAFLITPNIGLGLVFPYDPASFFSQKGFILILWTITEFIIAAGLAWLWLVYVRFFGKRIIGSHTGSGSPKWKRRFLTLVMSGVWVILILPIALSQFLFTGFGINSLLFDEATMLKVFGAVIGALFLYGLIFCLSWVGVHVWRLVWPPRCPACGRVVSQKIVLGQMCEHCGQDLAPWLFAAPVQDSVSRL